MQEKRLIFCFRKIKNKYQNKTKRKEKTLVRNVISACDRTFDAMQMNSKKRMCCQQYRNPNRWIYSEYREYC